MANIPMNHDGSISVDNHLSINPYGQHVDDKQVPSYTCLNPLSNTIQPQLQNQREPIVPTAPVQYVPVGMNPELTNIKNYKCYLFSIFCFVVVVLVLFLVIIQ
jgi:hypothetical protein